MPENKLSYNTFIKKILPLKHIKEQNAKSSLVINYHKKMVVIRQIKLKYAWEDIQGRFKNINRTITNIENLLTTPPETTEALDVIFDKIKMENEDISYYSKTGIKYIEDYYKLLKKLALLTLKEVTNELNDLRQMAIKVAYDEKRNFLAITTDSIIRRGKNIGEWCIVVDLNGEGRYFDYRCYPLRDGASHNHLYSNYGLCLGAGWQCEQRINEGRITDFFTIVQQILRT